VDDAGRAWSFSRMLCSVHPPLAPALSSATASISWADFADEAAFALLAKTLPVPLHLLVEARRPIAHRRVASPAGRAVQAGRVSIVEIQISDLSSPSKTRSGRRFMRVNQGSSSG